MERIDFLPERIKVHRARQRRLVRRGYLLAAFVAALVALGYVRQGRVGKAQAELDMLLDHADNVTRQLETRSSLERQLADLMIKKRIDEHLGSRVDALDVLSELDRLLPESMALTSLAFETMELAGPAEPVRHQSARAAAAERTRDRPRENPVKRIRLVLTGLAPSDVDVANFIGQLSGGPLFEDVHMNYAKNVVFRGRKAREFQASCYVVP